MTAECSAPDAPTIREQRNRLLATDPHHGTGVSTCQSRQRPREGFFFSFFGRLSVARTLCLLERGPFPSTREPNHVSAQRITALDVRLLDRPGQQ
jgi:hypothetical protein